jgi:hypothetical protein
MPRMDVNGCENSDGPVDEGVEGRELGAGTQEGRRELPDGDLDGEEAGLDEDVHLDVVGNHLRILELDRLWHHPDSHNQRAEGRCRTSVGEAESHDGCEALPDFPLEVFSGIQSQEGMTGWPWMGRNSQRKGWVFGPPVGRGRHSRS